MVKKFSPAKSKSSGKPRRKRTSETSADSASAEIKEVAAKAKQLAAKTTNLLASSEKIQDSAAVMHDDVENVHANIEDTHAQIRAAEAKAKIRKTKAAQKSELKKPRLIVGIGASVGGLEALTDFLKHLPVDTGLAFILVQHLDPTHPSHLAELLSRLTKLPVVEIRNRMPIVPNRICVIPPNRSLKVSNGLLKIAPRKAGEHLTVDSFFQSLARDQGNRAVGIILSGNGNDGTIGLKAIKAAGGLTLAQDEKSAKSPSMPQNAIRNGCVDLVLPPDKLAQELASLAKRGTIQSGSQTQEKPASATEDQLAKIFNLLRNVTGVDFSSYKTTTLQRRIMRRIVLKKIDDVGSYLAHLQQNPAEVESLFHDILINVTGFFRDPGAFTALRKKIFPRLLNNRPPRSPVRIWVPGCATGEEVYSLAICLHEFLGKNLHHKAIQIFGTDISENMVRRARAGIYPTSIAEKVSPERLLRYFQKTDSGYQIAKFIRDLCVFARQNVAEDPPFSNLDLISCRNLLIYLGLNLQRKVLPIFHYSLRPQGYLMLGTSETIGSYSHLFTLVDKRNKIYARNETYTRSEMEFLPMSRRGSEDRPTLALRSEAGKFDLQKRANEIVLSEFSPPGIVINSRLEVLHFRGKIGPYLEPAPGVASLNLFKMTRDELATDLRTTVEQARRTNLPVRKTGVRLRSNGPIRQITLEVIPFKHSGVSEWFYLILFNASAEKSQPSKPGRRRGAKPDRVQEDAARLHEELIETKESLQSIIEEQEATNEELKSANEEIQSSNEELQSTNEELETAKEELQSTNEELTTLNEELQNRNMDLSLANNDLNNLIGSFNMPIVMLGNDLNIRRFTPLAQKLFNLIPSDLGRRISDINPNIALPNLSDLVADVIETLNVREMEVQDREGHWYSLRIRPYRTSDNRIEGAVIVVVDIGEVRQGLEEVTEIVPFPMLLLSSDLRVTKANEIFYENFQVIRKETEGQTIFKLGNGQWNIPALRTLLETMLPKNQKVENFKVEHHFPAIGRRVFLFNARRLYQVSKGTYYILVLLRDVTAADAPA